LVMDGVRTADGELFANLDVGEVVESYPFQQFLGKQLFIYNVSCFIIPFVLEPILMHFLPRYFGILHVRTRMIGFRDSVRILIPQRMDLGRYADHLLNLTLMCMTFFCASGWILYSAICLVVGNIFVYC